ncbi:MAG: carbon-nitrogen family hydrolase [Verrucomicrobiae bacterium]|nr:carbon-nitrogen family hydrolase [Verrucomicrobiae bacterium]
MKLTISLAQIEVAKADPGKNLKKAETLVSEAARKGSDLVCFPEMWTTGFQWDRNKAMAADHEKVIARVAELARQHRIWINGSMLALDEKGRVSNTAILFDAQGGPAAVYRKTHLFTLLHEEEHMAPGQSLAMADTPWGRAGFSICYDIRFPELFRTYALKGAQFVMLPSAFPHPRLPHWQVLTRARAIENQMFMIGVNQVGGEDFGSEGKVRYFGHSCVIDPWGETVAEAGEDEALLTVSLEIDQVKEVRNKMRVLKDRRPELYELD